MICKRVFNAHLLIGVSLSIAILTCQMVHAQASSPQGVTPALFLPAVTYNSGGFGATSVVVADVNGDGKPDLVIANCDSTANSCFQLPTGNGVVGVLVGNGDGTFQPALVYDSGGLGA